MEIGLCISRAQEEIQRLGGDSNRIMVDYEALQKSWTEKRGL
jgi:hypothetical protein